jgi:hypothetical protein
MTKAIEELMHDKHRGEPLYMDVERFLANKAGTEAVAIAMDLIGYIWLPTKIGFVFDEGALALRLATKLPARGYTSDMLRRNRESVSSFFTVLPDGRWVPSPEYFSLTDGNSERALTRRL